MFDTHRNSRGWKGELLRFLATIVLVIGLYCPVFVSAQARPEQVTLTYGDNRAVGTVIGHSGVCFVLTVRHFLDMPGRELRVHAPDRAAPLEPNAVAVAPPPWAQGAVDARLAELQGWPTGCPVTLGHVRDDRWSRTLAENMLNGVFDGRLTLRLIAGTRLIDVPVRLAQSPEPDKFDFYLDPQATGSVPDRAGISGSGVYFNGELIGIVTGAANDISDAFGAARIETIVRFLGLAVEGPAAQGEDPSGDAIATVFDLTAPSPSFVTRCDESAARPNDPARHPDVEGVAFDDIEIPGAVEDCAWAEDEYPGSPRLTYQLGRAYHAAYEADAATYPIGRALDKLNEALTAGHRATIDNLSSLLERDHPDCGGMESCIRAYRRSLGILERFDPVAAAIRSARMQVNGDLAAQLCPDTATCVSDLAAAYEMVPRDSADYAEAQAQIAFLVLQHGLLRACPDDPGCLGFAQQALSRRSVEGAGWATNWLANLYARNDAVPGACDTRLACQQLALTTWQLAADQGEIYGIRNQADKARYEEWQAAFGCADAAACRLIAHTLYRQALDAGQADLAGEVVYDLLYEQEAVQCGAPDDCIATARTITDVSGFLDRPWHKSLLAEVIRHYPGSFADLCSVRDCRAEVYRLHLEAANDGNAFSMGQVADFHYFIQPFGDEEPDARLTGCATDEECLLAATQWYERAFAAGQTSILDEWLSAIHLLVGVRHDTVGEALAIAGIPDLLDPWLTAAEEVEPSNLSEWTAFLFVEMTHSVLDDSPICGVLQPRCEIFRNRILTSFLAVDVTEEDLVVIAGALDCSEGCSTLERAVLARAASAGDVRATADLAISGGLDQTICPFDKPACTDAEATTIRAMISAMELSQLYPLEDHILGTFAVEETGLPPADRDWLIDLLIEKGSARIRGSVEYAYLRNLFDSDRTYDDIPDVRVYQVAEGLFGAIEDGLVNGNDYSLCRYAVHLVYLQNHDVLDHLNTEEEADLILLYLAICGEDDRENGDRWLSERPRSLRVEVQRRLGVTADGDFGNASWAAANELHLALFPRVVVVMPDGEAAPSTIDPADLARAEQTLATWPSLTLLERSRDALLR